MTRGIRALVALALLCALAACGVPTGGQAQTIPASDVPYGLTTPSPEPATATAPSPMLTSTLVYLVAGDDGLVGRGRDVTGASSRDRLDALLDELAEGPTARERDEQLSTALPPEVELTVTGVSDGTATIDLSGAEQAPSGGAGRRAVAQLVLTATSVPGVDAVVLTLDGQRVDAPLPSGELTPVPLTAADYQSFLSPAPTASALPAPPT
ncbi:GerMN domain-containing protein [Geodermatophilus ruber]|uniref:Sporulation and spore germination n=1 Tax=Geodermatophilus ruber TaxID=504800 RepID=A0A1I4LEK8_9ACTN|nr:GerMN domain-containing protein [Geodermatophilus ruber]SFL89351.1 Sporulation and spore germination [Geodermatophilus ruber]